MGDGNGWRGWIKLYRKLIYSEIWKNPQLLKFWIWCLMKASTKKTKVLVGNQYVDIEPGQFVTGRKSAAEANEISECTANRYLKTLENMEMLHRKTNNRFTLVTIENWESYQTQKSEGDTTADTTSDTTADTTSDTQTRIYKKNKKNKNNNRTSSKRIEEEEDEPIDWNWDDIPIGGISGE